MSYYRNKADFAPRFCDRHRDKSPIEGGEYRKTDESHHVWVCADCLRREKERDKREG